MVDFVARKKNTDARVTWAGPAPLALTAKTADGKLTLLEASQHAEVDAKLLKEWSACKRAVVLLPPEMYAFALLPSPALPLSGNASADEQAMRESLRWSFAKDAEFDMESAEFEVLQVKGAEQGGGLLKDHHWVFAVDGSALKALLEPMVRAKVRIEAVDVLATAQRNLCWAEVLREEHGVKQGAFASVVVGKSYSALGIVSAQGDLLFHKQLEGSETSLKKPENREQLILNLQRNLDYFERRLSALGMAKGYVYGQGAQEIAESIKGSLRGFEWVAGSYPGVDWGQSKLDPQTLSGDWAWLLGALWRLA
jgi:hypothetical protein